MSRGVGALGDTAGVVGLLLAHAGRAAWTRLRSLASRPAHAAGRVSEKLLIAPQDLRTSDPTRAAEIYSGVFALAGRSVSVEGRSPFLVEPPSREWADALHGFGWLRHLRAADTTLSRANARALVDEWIGLRGGPDRAAHAPETTARRVIAWLCQSPLILDGADRAFYRRYLRSLTRQTRYLARAYPGAQDGLPRLTAVAALVYAGLCLSGEARLLKIAVKALGEELERQILPDGGHVGRNPATIVEILLDLLPLRQAFTARNEAPPQALITAVDRMMPMLRFFRHGGGDIAQFNGAGPTRADLAATILAYDDARGSPVEDAPHSGYQRMAAEGGVVIMDAGRPPPPEFSREAHAGCLSFEFSSGVDPIVVNCGSPRSGRKDWEDAARSTAAHSTATLGDVSSCRFLGSDRLRRLMGTPIVAGPTTVPVRRERTADGVKVVASHDGYVARFGIVHERALTLAADGSRLEGEDVFRPAGGSSREDVKVALRFHLHPAVRVSVRQDGEGALLAPPGGAGWVFSAPGFLVAVEESVYLSGAHGPRRTEQIAIYATARGAPKIAWSFERLASEPVRPRMPVAPDFGPLPL